MSLPSEIEQGLAAFAALLEAEYGQPFASWREAAHFGERESLQISRALGLLLKEPIADVVLRSPAEIAASETGGRRSWVLNDAKIASPAWEQSWQWKLLAEIDNASKAAGGGMMTPSDPRLFLLAMRYERDFFALIAGHLQDFLCDRPGFAQCADASAVLDRLRHVPGLPDASPAFLAGMLLLIGKLGPKGFCDWCEERAAATDDDA